MPTGNKLSKKFKARADKLTSSIEPYLGKSIKSLGKTMTLVGCNDRGVLYWVKDKGKRQYTIGSYSIINLPNLFPNSK